MSRNDHAFLRWLTDAGIITPDEATRAPISGGEHVSIDADDPATRSWINSMLENSCAEMAATPEGERNDTLYRKSFRVGTFVEYGYVPRIEAETKLYNSAAISGLEHAEIIRTIRHGFNDARQAPKPTIPPLNSQEGTAGFVLDEDYTPNGNGAQGGTQGGEQASQEEKRSRYVTGEVFIFDAPETLDAVWGEGSQILWASGEALTLVGPPGVGKTTIGQQLALSRCGMWDKLFELPVRPTGSKVLYLAMDRPRQAARSMRRMVDETHREMLREKLIVWKGPPPHDVAKKPDILLALAIQAGADTIVVDSVKDAAVGLVDSEMAGNYNRARQTALAAGVEVLEIAHPRKSSGDRKSNKSIDDQHGGMEIAAGAGSIVMIDGQPGDLVVELVHRKQPLEVVGPMKLLHDHVAGRTSIFEKVTALDVLRNHPEGMLSVRDVAMKLNDTDKITDAQKEATRYQLEKLVAAGLAIRTTPRIVPGVLRETVRYKAKGDQTTWGDDTP